LATAEVPIDRSIVHACRGWPPSRPGRNEGIAIQTQWTGKRLTYCAAHPKQDEHTARLERVDGCFDHVDKELEEVRFQVTYGLGVSSINHLKARLSASGKVGTGFP
jgi:hypothetical protein